MYNVVMDEENRIPQDTGSEGDEAEKIKPVDLDGERADTRVATSYVDDPSGDISAHSWEGARRLNEAARRQILGGHAAPSSLGNIIKENIERAAEAGPAETLPVDTEPDNQSDDNPTQPTSLPEE